MRGPKCHLFNWFEPAFIRAENFWKFFFKFTEFRLGFRIIWISFPFYVCIKTFVIWINGIRSHTSRIEWLLSVPSDSIDHWIKLPPKAGFNAQRIRMGFNQFEQILWTSVCETITKIMYTDVVVTHTTNEKSNENSTTTGSILYFDFLFSFLERDWFVVLFLLQWFPFVRAFVRSSDWLHLLALCLVLEWLWNENVMS